MTQDAIFSQHFLSWNFTFPSMTLFLLCQSHVEGKNCVKFNVSLASLLWSIQSSFVNASAAHHQDITTWYVLITSNLYDFCNKISNNRMQMFQQIKTQKTDPESESGSQAFSYFWIQKLWCKKRENNASHNNWIQSSAKKYKG